MWSANLTTADPTFRSSTPRQSTTRQTRTSRSPEERLQAKLTLERETLMYENDKLLQENDRLREENEQLRQALAENTAKQLQMGQQLAYVTKASERIYRILRNQKAREYEERAPNGLFRTNDQRVRTTMPRSTTIGNELG